MDKSALTLAAMILQFSESERRNEWLHFDGLRVYVRNAIHALDGSLTPTLDLASIEFDLEKQGQGHFASILDFLEEHCKKVLFVENVISPRFQNFFERRAGWERQQLCWEVAVPSFYKPLK